MEGDEQKEKVEMAPTTGDGRPVEGEVKSDEEKPIESEEAKAAKLEMVQSCLEELLSKQNLAEDAFIQQHMNAQMYVPLCILAGHHRVTKLGQGIDVAALLEAAQRSEKLGVDEEHLLVRPLMKPRRNTLILHDLPDDVEEQELTDLFKSSPESEALCSVKPDVNRTAYATFQTDEAAQTVALWLRSQTLRGSSVKCAVKAEHFLRSFFPAVPGTPPCGMSMAPYGMSGQQVVWAWPGNWQDTGAVGAQYGNSMEMWGEGTDASGAWSMGGEGAPKGGGKHFQDGGAKGRGGKSKGKGKGKRKGEGMPHGVDAEMSQMEAMQRVQKSPAMRMRGDSFVPIQEPLEPVDDGTVVDDSELGYKHEFRKYGREQIIEVCSGMDDLIKPESFTRFEHEEKDVTLFRQSPYKDWAPLPTPQITFASGVFSGEGRRSTGDGSSIPGSPLVDSLGMPPPRKGSEMSRSWTSSRRSRSQSRGRMESGEPEDWGANAAAWESSEWDEWCGDASWSKGADSRGSWRRRGSSWSDWYGGSQQWVEKTQVAEEAEETDRLVDQEQWGPKRMSWAEKVKGTRERSLSTGPQRWQAKKKADDTEAPKQQGSVPAPEEAKPMPDEKEGAAEVKAADQGAARVEAPPAKGATQSTDNSKGASEAAAPAQPSKEPEGSAEAPAGPKPHAPTWAERVKLGQSKGAPKPAPG